MFAQEANPCVNQELLVRIQTWLDAGATMDDVVDRLRPLTVPQGYQYHNWKSGTSHFDCSVLSRSCTLYDLFSVQERVKVL